MGMISQNRKVLKQMLDEERFNKKQRKRELNKKIRKNSVANHCAYKKTSTKFESLS